LAGRFGGFGLRHIEIGTIAIALIGGARTKWAAAAQGQRHRAARQLHACVPRAPDFA